MQLISRKQLGALGRLILPSELRKTWGLKPGSTISIHVDKDKMILTPVKRTKKGG